MTKAVAAADFAPDLLAIQDSPPARLPRAVGYVTALLFTGLAAWSVWGRLDVVASAEGRLIPRSLSRVVQPAEAGIVREVLVREGEEVGAGQVLLRMDMTAAHADLNSLRQDFALKRLELRRIEAELSGRAFVLAAGDAQHGLKVLEHFRARRLAHEDALAQEQAAFDRAQHELAAARQSLDKLAATVPLYRKQAASYEKLVKDGFVSELGANDKIRERIEKEQEHKAQQSAVAALEAALDQSRRKMAQIGSAYSSQLQNERIELVAAVQKTEAELGKQDYRSSLLELRSPAPGVVKDLISYTPGVVVQPGTVLMNVVPKDEPLIAEVAMKNEDAGFVAPGQMVRVKLQAYPFQKYGMLDGTVEIVGADSTTGDPQRSALGQGPQTYKVWVRLPANRLKAPDGEMLKLAPGMLVTAEIHQGHRTVLEYLLSPVRKVAGEAARER